MHGLPFFPPHPVTDIGLLAGGGEISLFFVDQKDGYSFWHNRTAFFFIFAFVKKGKLSALLSFFFPLDEEGSPPSSSRIKEDFFPPLLHHDGGLYPFFLLQMIFSLRPVNRITKFFFLCKSLTCRPLPFPPIFSPELARLLFPFFPLSNPPARA